MDNNFSFQNRDIRKWLVGVAIISLLFTILMPPSFWLCGLGVAFLVTSNVANSIRTNQWMSWQNEGSLNWFEGWAASTGAVLITVPLLAVIIRALAI